MKIKVITLDRQKEQAELEAFGSRHTVALLPHPTDPDAFQFYGVMYRLHPKDDYLVQRVSTLRRATLDEATTRLKMGDWTVPKLPPEDGFVPVAVAWLRPRQSRDF